MAVPINAKAAHASDTSAVTVAAWVLAIIRNYELRQTSKAIRMTIELTTTPLSDARVTAMAPNRRLPPFTFARYKTPAVQMQCRLIHPLHVVHLLFLCRVHSPAAFAVNKSASFSSRVSAAVVMTQSDIECGDTGFEPQRRFPIFCYTQNKNISFPRKNLFWLGPLQPPGLRRTGC